MFGRRNYETNYEELSGFYDDHDNNDDGGAATAVPFQAPESASSKNTKWNHVQNLDEFFTRVYKYHQKRGFFCILLSDLLDLLQFLFVMALTSFLAECVDYQILFGNKDAPNGHQLYPNGQNHHNKTTIGDCIKTCSLHKFHRFETKLNGA